MKCEWFNFPSLGIRGRWPVLSLAVWFPTDKIELVCSSKLSFLWVHVGQKYQTKFLPRQGFWPLTQKSSTLTTTLLSSFHSKANQSCFHFLKWSSEKNVSRKLILTLTHSDPKTSIDAMNRFVSTREQCKHDWQTVVILPTDSPLFPQKSHQSHSTITPGISTLSSDSTLGTISATFFNKFKNKSERSLVTQSKHLFRSTISKTASA